MIKDKGFDIIISSDSQYDELCAEIYFDGEFVAILSRENGIDNMILEIDPPANMKNWTFKYSEFTKILQEAQESLIKTDEKT